MKVQDIMTQDVACCSPNDKLNQVARMMVEHDCGELPVCDSRGKAIGVITDRDICCRAVADNLLPSDTSASQCMSTPVVSVSPDMSIKQCCQILEEHLIRRVPVVDRNGMVCGIVSQADIARNTDGKVSDVVRSVSTPTREAAHI